MGLFSRLTHRVPRGVAIAVMGFSGIFGIRTPPDPEVVAQTAPRPDAMGEGSPYGRQRERGRPEVDEDRE
jgi:hypothetical protein